MRTQSAAAEVATSDSGRNGNSKRIARIVAVVEIDNASPSELRERFIEAVRAGIQRAWSAGRIDLAQAEELIRAMPAITRAKKRQLNALKQGDSPLPPVGGNGDQGTSARRT